MLILLDIDGVFIPAKSWEVPELLDDGFPDFTKRSVESFNILISDDDTVILTTSHRNRFDTDKWKDIFSKRGINISNIKCLPESINTKRKDDIINWFNSNSITEDFLIIDDDKSLNDLPQILKEKLIQPNSYIGLVEENIKNI